MKDSMKIVVIIVVFILTVVAAGITGQLTKGSNSEGYIREIEEEPELMEISGNVTDFEYIPGGYGGRDRVNIEMDTMCISAPVAYSAESKTFIIVKNQTYTFILKKGYLTDYRRGA